MRRKPRPSDRARQVRSGAWPHPLLDHIHFILQIRGIGEVVKIDHGAVCGAREARPSSGPGGEGGKGIGGWHLCVATFDGLRIRQHPVGGQQHHLVDFQVEQPAQLRLDRTVKVAGEPLVCPWRAAAPPGTGLSHLEHYGCGRCNSGHSQVCTELQWLCSARAK